MSPRYVILLPSYNSGKMLAQTVRSALRVWSDVWVVIDGSDDGSDLDLPYHDGLRVIRRSENGGKGAAVFDGLAAARQAGFTHALIMDADGQHDASCITSFISSSRELPESMVLGAPRFGPGAPLERIWGRKIANFLVRRLGSRVIGDSLFGFRLYPIEPLWQVMQATRHMRGFDFEPEAVIRMAWLGTDIRNLSVPVRYFRKSEGGISHFNYGRDNLLLARMFVRLGLTSFKRSFRPCPR